MNNLDRCCLMRAAGEVTRGGPVQKDILLVFVDLFADDWSRSGVLMW